MSTVPVSTTTRRRRIPVLGTRVVVVREDSIPFAEPVQANTPRIIAGLFNAYLADADREHLVAFLLDTKHRVVGVHEIAAGTLDSVHTNTREMFRAAVASNAKGLALAHNHPSGDTNPSEADHALTETAVRAGRVLGIAVLDHVIVAPDGSFYSFLERGLLARIPKDDTEAA